MVQAVGTPTLQVRDILQALSLQQLLVLSQSFRVKFTPGVAKVELVNTLLASKKFPEVPRDILTHLELPTLRHLCWVRGVDVVSEVPEVLIDALLTQRGNTQKRMPTSGGDAFRRLPDSVRKEFSQHREHQARRFRSDIRHRHIRAVVHGICVACVNIALGTIAYDFTLSLGLGLVRLSRRFRHRRSLLEPLQLGLPLWCHRHDRHPVVWLSGRPHPTHHVLLLLVPTADHSVWAQALSKSGATSIANEASQKPSDKEAQTRESERASSSGFGYDLFMTSEPTPELPGPLRDSVHEDAFVDSFVRPNAYERFQKLSGPPAIRSQALDLLNDSQLLLTQYGAYVPPGNAFPELIHNLLLRYRAPELCYVIADEHPFDKTRSPSLKRFKILCRTSSALC